MRGRSRPLFPAVLAFAAGLLAASAASAAMSADQIKAAIEKEYGVKVLSVKAATFDGRAVYRVTMMNPGGNYNTAFQVNAIDVDAETGKPVSQFHHETSGYDYGPAEGNETNRQPVDVLREKPWR
jgi:hypothetical protein